MVTKTKARPRPAARPKPKSAGVKPRAPARTPAPRPKPKSQVKTTGNVDYYRPFVTITQGLLKRISPFLTFLLTPTAVADGTITAKDQKRLEAYFRDVPSRAQAEAKTGAKPSRSESAVSGAALVGRWFAAVADDRSSYRLQKAGLSALLGGVDASLDAALARDEGLSPSATRPRIDAIAGQKLVRSYEKDPANALNDLASSNKATRQLARSWLARHPIQQPAPRPSQRPATRPVEVPRSPTPGKPTVPSKVPPKVPVALRRNCLRRSRSPLRSIGGRSCSKVVWSETVRSCGSARGWLEISRPAVSVTERNIGGRSNTRSTSSSPAPGAPSPK